MFVKQTVARSAHDIVRELTVCVFKWIAFAFGPATVVSEQHYAASTRAEPVFPADGARPQCSACFTHLVTKALRKVDPLGLTNSSASLQRFSEAGQLP
eukprot:10448-Heterococcus_DN1.PRE.2